jgi:NhaP-type Na+/H+ or K+/H+ antiporter
VKSFFFVLLGITFSTALLDKISPLLIVAMVLLILVARFIASAILSRFDKEVSKYRMLISIMIPRGYVAAVLAFVPAQEGIKIPLLTDIIVILIIITTVIAIAGTMTYGKSHPNAGKRKK